LSDYNGNRLLGFTRPITFAQQVPEVVLGAPDLTTDTLLSHHFITNPTVATDGESLVIGSGYDRTLSIWREIPTRSGTPPTVRIDEIDSASDIALHDGVLVVAGKLATLKIWASLPYAGEDPDWAFAGSIGSVTFNRVPGIALDDTYFYLSDGTGQIHVWSGIPLSGEAPLFTLQPEGAEHDLQSDGQHLVASSGGVTLIYEVASLALDLPERIAKTDYISASRGEAQVSGDQFYLVDFGFNRVHAWRNWRDAVAGQAPDTFIGATGADDIDPGISPSSLFWPKRLAIHGHRLWVGEYKFSGRVVLFETPWSTLLDPP
jgi:WD40 repeat protein